MGLFKLFALFIYYLLNIYMLIFMLRIIVSWLMPNMFSKWTQYLYKLTDPLLNFCRQLGWLRFSGLDFSPILAFGFLIFFNQFFYFLATRNAVNIGFLVIYALLAATRSVLNGISFIFFLACGIQLIMVLIETRMNNFFTQIVKSLTDPLVIYIRKLIPLNHKSSYAIYLGILTGFFFLLMSVVIRELFDLLLNLVSGLNKIGM